VRPREAPQRFPFPKILACGRKWGEVERNVLMKLALIKKTIK
jgi:hypothetical protein